MKTFFTADLHLGHTNILRYANRPFKTIEEMDEAIIERWNKKIQPGDRVFLVGDFAFRNGLRYRARLNGRITLIRGNHDKPHRLRGVFEDVYDLFTFKEKDFIIVLCHFALRVWDRSHFGAWHLFGHSHGKLPGLGKSFDVGVDAHNFEPRSLDEIVAIMKTLPDNENMIRPAP